MPRHIKIEKHPKMFCFEMFSILRPMERESGGKTEEEGEQRQPVNIEILNINYTCKDDKYTEQQRDRDSGKCSSACSFYCN